MADTLKQVTRMRSAMLALITCLVLVAASCGGDSDAGTEPDAGTDTTVAQAGDDSESSSEPDDTPDAPSDEVAMDGGTASLTIDGVTYEFDSFICGFGYENTGDDEMNFAAAGEGTAADGTPIQVAVQLFDTGLREGFRQVQFLQDSGSGDFDVVWALTDTEALAVEDSTGRAVLMLEGDDLSIEGGAYDRLEDLEETGEQAQGSLIGVCSPDSLR